MTGQKCVPLPCTIKELQHPQADCFLGLLGIFVPGSWGICKPVIACPLPGEQLFRSASMATFCVYPLEGGQIPLMKDEAPVPRTAIRVYHGSGRVPTLTAHSTEVAGHGRTNSVRHHSSIRTRGCLETELTGKVVG